MYESLGKPVLDRTGAAVLLLLLGPVLVGIALVVLVRDGRPVLYAQTRLGRGGRPFRILKFRTMTTRVDSDQGSFDAGDDSRVTRSGHWLRASKLDELPQLLNVLRGDMSLVGPRPEIARWIGEFPDRWDVVLRVRPGITDNASLLYRYEERELAASTDPVAHYRTNILPRKLDLYEKYVDDISLWNDVRILFRTLTGVFFRS